MNLYFLTGVNINVPIWLLLIFGILISYYLYMTWENNIFKKLGIPGPKPTPIIGTLSATFKKGFGGHDKELVEKYGNIVGAFMGRQPFIIIADVGMAKQILVKQFNKFVDRTDLDLDDDISGNMIQLVKEHKWRNLRTTLSPTFSTGKLKRMTKHIIGCADQVIENLQSPTNDGTVIDFKDYAQSFTMDTIARTAFGLEINSKTDKESKFVEMANKSMNSSLKSPIFIIIFFFRFLTNHMSKLGLRVFPKEGSTFFSQVINQVIDERKKEPRMKHPDFIQLMLTAHKDDSKDADEKEDDQEHTLEPSEHFKKRPLTENEILASCVIFFLAGYETTANTLSFAVNLLATNPDCQEKLFKEIDNVLQGKEPEYADMPNLPYLEQVIDETLRLHPQAPRIQRIANQDVTLNDLHIPKGMEIAIPVIYLHHNPKYWQHPEKFDPERFTPEEKAKRDPYCYLPFGHGPRNCIGMRLALTELKIVLIKILQNYEIKSCPETKVNLKAQKVRAGPDGGVFVIMKRRE